jgi:hypothetical protein
MRRKDKDVNNPHIIESLWALWIKKPQALSLFIVIVQ